MHIPKITLLQLKKALIVLLQHGIVHATSEERVVPLPPAVVRANQAAAAAAASSSSSSSSSASEAGAVATTRLVTITHYEIDVVRIFYRLRFPKYTLLMKDLLGPMAEVRGACIAEIAPTHCRLDFFGLHVLIC